MSRSAGRPTPASPARSRGASPPRRFVSTRGRCAPVDLARAVFSGTAPDGGLWVPQRIDAPPATTLELLGRPDPSGAELHQTATAMLAHLLAPDLDLDEVRSLVEAALDFPIPLREIAPDRFALELFWGPTLAFKDIGARFMARLMEHLLERGAAPASLRADRPLTILVATSGDTGSAVAHAFSGLARFEVVVLFPRGQVSEAQRRLFTTLGGNVTALEVDGAFDDCQRMVKTAFADAALQRARPLASANSINLARLLPQCVYHGHLRRLLAERVNEHGEIVVSVPSGNFGNLTAALLARRLGVRLDRLVASTNVNDVVPRYLSGGAFQPRPAVATLSNAMDVGDPSNFERIAWLFGEDDRAIRAAIEGRRFDDEETLAAIARVRREHGYTLDPHGAVAWLGLEASLRERPGVGALLETAHPAKFAETVERATGEAPGEAIELPDTILRAAEAPEHVEALLADASALRARLLG
ncbi:MAG TPA: threonine synthase [Thermoanaerobaculia bacterium]|nr:threonine synthase [Thermoanaerobaculia bacterium]